MRATQTIPRHQVSRNVNVLHRGLATPGDRLADDVARLCGSWTFVGVLCAVLLIWVGVNTFRLLVAPFDRFPFLLLNLVLSTLIALVTPLILMSLNRQAAHHRLSAEADDEFNQGLETQVEDLRRKMDSLREDQWAELMAFQLRQIELLEQIIARQARRRPRMNGAATGATPETVSLAADGRG